MTVQKESVGPCEILLDDVEVLDLKLTYFGNIYKAVCGGARGKYDPHPRKNK